MEANWGGCCGGGHIQHKNIETGTKDPVCGMQVNEKTTEYKAEFQGKTYYFCSSTCETAFKNVARTSELRVIWFRKWEEFLDDKVIGG